MQVTAYLTPKLAAKTTFLHVGSCALLVSQIAICALLKVT
jgi:hypothetical protein